MTLSPFVTDTNAQSQIGRDEPGLTARIIADCIADRSLETVVVAQYRRDNVYRLFTAEFVRSGAAFPKFDALSLLGIRPFLPIQVLYAKSGGNTPKMIFVTELRPRMVLVFDPAREDPYARHMPSFMADGSVWILFLRRPAIEDIRIVSSNEEAKVLKNAAAKGSLDHLLKVAELDGTVPMQNWFSLVRRGAFTVRFDAPDVPPPPGYTKDELDTIHHVKFPDKSEPDIGQPEFVADLERILSLKRKGEWPENMTEQLDTDLGKEISRLLLGPPRN